MPKDRGSTERGKTGESRRRRERAREMRERESGGERELHVSSPPPAVELLNRLRVRKSGEVGEEGWLGVLLAECVGFHVVGCVEIVDEDGLGVQLSVKRKRGRILWQRTDLALHVPLHAAPVVVCDAFDPVEPPRRVVSDAANLEECLGGGLAVGLGRGAEGRVGG